MFLHIYIQLPANTDASVYFQMLESVLKQNVNNKQNKY